MDHFHHNIQGWFQCEPLYRRMVQQAQNGAVFVEVGVWKGKSAAFMAVEIANSGKKIDFYAVDHFKGSPEHQDDKSVLSNTLKDECYKNLEPVSKFIKMLPISSAEAAKMFADESLDFVYIDGAHEYEPLVADIGSWFPKVKKGGILAGDDYGNDVHPDVKFVVDMVIPNATKEGLVWWVQK